MLQSVMRETLESMSTGGDHVDAEDGEEEAKAAAAAALAMGSMCRANTNDGVGVGSVDAEMGDMGREMSGAYVLSSIPCFLAVCKPVDVGPKTRFVLFFFRFLHISLKRCRETPPPCSETMPRWRRAGNLRPHCLK